MTNCDATEAMKALSYLTRSFGGFKIPEDEQRSFLRLFRKFSPATVAAAIDELVVKSSRRPSPNELAQAMRKSRPAVADTRSRLRVRPQVKGRSEAKLGYHVTDPEEAP